MAVTAAWHVELDGVDEASVKLMLHLHLQDVEDLKASSTASEAAALRVYETQLKAERAIRASIGGYVNEPINATSSDSKSKSTDDKHSSNPFSSGFVPTFKCVLCMDRFDVEHCYQVPCEDYYCDGDLEELFRRALTDTTLYPPRCCRQPIPFDDVSLFLSEGLRHDFQAKREELDDTKPTYCHVPACSTYIGDKNKSSTTATCPTCSSRTCIECKQAFHIADCVNDAATEVTLQIAEEEGWRRCPGCECMVELHSGCFHITCRCRTQFCYLCGVRWKNCRCPQFSVDRLLERGQRIADRENRNINTVMDNLRVNHDCTDHNWEYVPGRHTCDECDDVLNRYIYRCRRCRVLNCMRCRHNRE